MIRVLHIAIKRPDFISRDWVVRLSCTSGSPPTVTSFHFLPFCGVIRHIAGFDRFGKAYKDVSRVGGLTPREAREVLIGILGTYLVSSMLDRTVTIVGDVIGTQQNSATYPRLGCS